MKITKKNSSSSQGAANNEIKIESGLHPATIVAAFEGTSEFQGQNKEGFWVVMQVHDVDDDKSPVYWITSKFMTPYFNTQTNAGKFVNALSKCEFTDDAIEQALFDNFVTEDGGFKWDTVIGSHVTVNVNVHSGKQDANKKFLSCSDISKESKRLGSFDIDTSKTKIPSFIASPFNWGITEAFLAEGFCVYDFKNKKVLYGTETVDESKDSCEVHEETPVKDEKPKKSSPSKKDAPTKKEVNAPVEEDDDDGLPF